MTQKMCFNGNKFVGDAVQEVSPNPTDPIIVAATVSANYTPQMHAEARDRLVQQIRDSQHPSRITDPQILDLYEAAIYHAGHTENPTAALDLYDNQLGGYEHVGGRLGDYRRGLRITTFLMSVLGADYMDVLASPAHDHNLYLFALGHPESAEQQTRHLLQRMREIAQVRQNDGGEDDWTHPLGFWRQNPDRGFVMYEAVLLQTQCDALLAQGKLQAAETIISEVLNQSHEWGPFGPIGKGRNGSNPYARRALVRALMGKATEALDDFKAADRFAAKYTKFTMFPSHDWHHRTLYAAFLARLGFLNGAQKQLDSMKSERIRGYRPLTTAEFDLASADIAYARTDYSKTVECTERVREWAVVSGHKQIFVRALIMLAKLKLRTNELDEAGKYLSNAHMEAGAAGFAIQIIDGFILSGYLALAAGNMDGATSAATEAETMSSRLVYEWGIGDAAHLLARCAAAQNNVDELLLHAERALSIRKRIQDPKITNTRTLILHGTSKAG